MGAALLPAQTPPTFIYVESFRKGPTRVTEQTLQLELDPANPTCAIAVKDQTGRDRYQFRCVPQRLGPGDNRILSWQVQLADMRHKFYGNVLMPTQDPTQDQTQIGWLDPGKFAKIPLTTERVVKVDKFYCIFKVTDSHFLAPEQPYLDRLSVSVRFSNTMAHSHVQVKQEKTTS